MDRNAEDLLHELTANHRADRWRLERLGDLSGADDFEALGWEDPDEDVGDLLSILSSMFWADLLDFRRGCL
jgi:hypothetical protein